MLRKKGFVLTVLALAFALVFAVSSCDNLLGGGGGSGGGGVINGGDDKGDGDEQPVDSMDDYYDLEPEMAPNANRATAKAGGTTQIGIPDYLLPAENDVRAVVTAAFAVHEDDTAIAQIMNQNGSTCTVRGLKLGSARVIVTVGDQRATVIVAVAPSAALYTLPAGAVRRLGEVEFYNAWWNDDYPDPLPYDYEDYTADPTYQLSWNWRNPDDYIGASTPNCGIDILSYFVDPGVADRRGWVRTTFGHGGWHYDLNGVTDEMVDGVQETGDVKLELKPEFIYDNGVPYLQITHTLTNTGSTALEDQKFGASADVMIFNQDDAPLTYLEYGALMTNENTYGNITSLPTVKLRLVCQAVQGVDDVDTLYLGTYPNERDHVYDDKRDDISAEDNLDTALNFSYQGISLNPGERKNFVVRFTQVQ